jgi:hypothetical protein
LLAPPLEAKGRQFDLVEEKNYAFKRFNVIPDTEQDIRDVVLGSNESVDFE